MGLVGGDADRSASVDSAAVACIQTACVTQGNPAQLAIKVPSPLPTCSQDKLMIAIREENTHYDVLLAMRAAFLQITIVAAVPYYLLHPIVIRPRRPPTETGPV